MDTDRWSSAVAETLRAERAAAQMSQDELAAKANIPRPTYLRYEKGTRRPTLVQIAQIADALGITLGKMVERIEHRAAGVVSAGGAYVVQPSSEGGINLPSRRAVQGRTAGRRSQGSEPKKDAEHN